MAETPLRLDDLVAALRTARADFDSSRRHALGRAALPSRDALVGVIKSLRAALFPAHFGPTDLTEDGVDFFVGHTLGRTLPALREQIRRGLCFACPHGGEEPDCTRCAEHADEITAAYAAQLPAIRDLLETDVLAAYEGDPAASSPDEAVVSYPGITAITHHRLAHPLYVLGVPLLPRIVAEIAHAETGIDIHPGATIGERFFIDHGTGVVIGETCNIGARVRLYQGVTLGAKSFPLDEHGRPIKGIARHPIVEDDVVVYAGATILGRVTIGRGSSIGGNVWLTRSVPPDTRITQAVARSDSFEGGSGI